MATPRDPSERATYPVHLFVDHSNMWFSAREEAGRRGEPTLALRLHAERLWTLLAAGRRVETAVMVASCLVPEAALAYYRHHFEVILVEPGRQTGTEQAGDEMLQNAIWRTVARPDGSGTVVLLTGDGAGWMDRRGFCPALAVARHRGLGVEVLAFERSTNGQLRSLAEAIGVFVPLEDFYTSITFIEDLRWATPVDLRRRATAPPRRLMGVRRQIVMEALDGQPTDRVGARVRMLERQHPRVTGDFREWIQIYAQVRAEWAQARAGEPFHETDVLDEALDRQGLAPRTRRQLVRYFAAYLAQRANQRYALPAAQSSAG